MVLFPAVSTLCSKLREPKENRRASIWIPSRTSDRTPVKYEIYLGFLTSVGHLVWNHISIQKPVACYVVGDQGRGEVYPLDEGIRNDSKRVGYRCAASLVNPL